PPDSSGPARTPRAARRPSRTLARPPGLRPGRGRWLEVGWSAAGLPARRGRPPRPLSVSWTADQVWTRVSSTPEGPRPLCKHTRAVSSRVPVVTVVTAPFYAGTRAGHSARSNRDREAAGSAALGVRAAGGRGAAGSAVFRAARTAGGAWVVARYGS